MRSALVLVAAAWLAGAGAAHASVVINELMPNPVGSDSGFEWVEIYNNGGQAVDISGWAIQRGTSAATPFGTRFTYPPGTVIGPGAYLVVADDQVTFSADFLVTTSLTMGNGTSGDGVRLVDGGLTVIDTVVYGSNNDDAISDDFGVPAQSLAPNPSVEGASLSRSPNGVDTNLSANDFVRATAPTPGSSNDVVVAPCGALGSGLVINEFAANPAGADAGLEWIELYNTGTAAIDLEGWGIEAGTSTFQRKHTFAAGTTLFPGQLLVVGGALVPEVEIVTDAELSLGNASSNADGLRVVDCGGVAADTVIYGPVNEDGWIDDNGQVATSLALKPPDGNALARAENGVDTNQSGVDFVLDALPTPGAANPVVEPVICEASSGGVTINEIFPDPDSSDTDKEWFELYNATGARISLAGWQVIAGTSDLESVDFELPGGLYIEPGEFLVVGGELVPEADVFAKFSLGNGTKGDGLRLSDCEGTVVDTVVYGESNEDEIPDDLGVVADPYGDPGSNQALFRVEDGGDTNSAEDWKVGRATPGETNFVDSTGGTGGGGGPSGGCGKGGPPSTGPGGEPPTKGCSSAPLGYQFGLIGLALMLVGARRRRA